MTPAQEYVRDLLSRAQEVCQANCGKLLPDSVVVEVAKILYQAEVEHEKARIEAERGKAVMDAMRWTAR